MKKISNFIVEKRNFIIPIFIILAIICVFTSQKVKINKDITEYLPSDSETRIGLDKMDEEFSDVNTTSSFSIMFKGLTDDEKQTILKELEETENVDSVDHDDSEDYNKGEYTLYTVNVDAKSDSETAKNVYEGIEEKYKDYDIETDGDIADENEVVLPTWILVVAVSGVIIILLFMCESYVEPFLFLFSILIAILLNNGTNIIFDSVSNITSSISAILQLALSMDYSIMLMNRFRQEKENEPDIKKAMKSALSNSIQSISSSSITTIVGLICLVFMSFTIGKDLGLVLAKGVLFSLLSIFCVLPGLILKFDKIISKTKKRSPSIKLDWLGKFSNKARYPLTIGFVAVFIASFFLKGNLDIAYTSSDNDEVGKIFGKNNQIAIIYNTADEEKVAKYLNEIKENDNVDQVLGYSNTINEKLKYDEMVPKLNDLGSDTDVQDYLLKVIYYKYYNPNEGNKMTFNEFVNFVQNDVLKQDDMKNKIDEPTKNNIDRLKNFTTEENINKQRTASDIASILEIDEADVKDIFTYYNSKNNNLKLSINEFINFMNTQVLTDEKYAPEVDSQTRADLNKLSKYISKGSINKKITSSEMAKLFDMSEKQTSDLYKYYFLCGNIDTKMSINEFTNFVLNDVLNSEYASEFDNETITNIKLLNAYSNINTINKELTSSELSNLFGLDESSVIKLLYLKYSAQDSETKMNISDFINQVNTINSTTDYLKSYDLSALQSVSFFAKNENNINSTKLPKANLAQIFDTIRPNLVETIYYIGGLPDSYMMTPQEFVDMIMQITNTSTEGGQDSGVFSLDEATTNNLKLLKLIIDDTCTENKTLYTATQISSILGLPTQQVNQLYNLIDMLSGNTSNWKSTPYEFVNIILNNINNAEVSNSIDEQTRAKLVLLNQVMTSTINNTTYTYSELATLINSDESKLKSVYMLYTTKNNTLSLTPLEFVNFILNHQNDSTLKSQLSSDTITDLNLVKTVMKDILNNKRYTYQELGSLLGIDNEKLKLLYGLYVSKNVNTNQTMSLNNFVEFILSDVMQNPDYSDKFDANTRDKLQTVNGVMKASLENKKYSATEIYGVLCKLSDTELDEKLIELVYMYFGSSYDFDNNWTLTVEQFVEFLNNDILKDDRFTDFIDDKMRTEITDSKETITDAKKLLVSDKYSRVVINTSFEPEANDTFEYIQKLQNTFNAEGIEFNIIGDSPMAYEMSKTFGTEFDKISALTIIAIYIVVMITFKDFLAPIILVGVIQCAVYMTMGILSLSGGSVYFIALLIVQSILMGSTIDYGILYTSYYLEFRQTKSRKESLIEAYNHSINTILTSGSILVIVTFVVGMFATAITAKICITLCKGTLCSIILIMLFLPAILATFDKFIVKKKKIFNK